MSILSKTKLERGSEMKQEMKMKSGIIAAFAALSVAANAAEYKPEKWNLEAREKFAEQRYGVFIVWGIYANYAQGEWYLHSGKLDRDAYERMVYGFYPSKYDAREWARIVRRSGAKYITITARHHDGFALWPSKMDDYNIGSTPFKRDIIGELAEACSEEVVLPPVRPPVALFARNMTGALAEPQLLKYVRQVFTSAASNVTTYLSFLKRSVNLSFRK